MLGARPKIISMAFVLSRFLLGQIWKIHGLKVGILGTQSPKHLRVKGLQIGLFKGLCFPNVNINIYAYPVNFVFVWVPLTGIRISLTA